MGRKKLGRARRKKKRWAAREEEEAGILGLG
jgi:hypothetical protein